MSSLQTAIDIFRTLQKYSHDTARKGYIEVFNRDWSRSNAVGVDKYAAATKTMNTHIHVMEGFTNLYFAWPYPEVKAAILELLAIMQTHLYDSGTKHLILYCDDDWKMLGTENSYGHDIETSWLLCESAEAVGDEALIAKIRRQCEAFRSALVQYRKQLDRQSSETPYGVPCSPSIWGGGSSHYIFLVLAAKDLLER